MITKAFSGEHRLATQAEVDAILDEVFPDGEIPSVTQKTIKSGRAFCINAEDCGGRLTA